MRGSLSSMRSTRCHSGYGTYGAAILAVRVNREKPGMRYVESQCVVVSDFQGELGGRSGHGSVGTPAKTRPQRRGSVLAIETPPRSALHSWPREGSDGFAVRS